MPRQMPVLSRLLTPFKGISAFFKGISALAFLRANDGGSTAAQRNGRSVFSYLSTVAAVAILIVTFAVLSACGGGSSTSKASAPLITTNPMNVTVTAGAAAQFTAAATGQPAPTVQWQLSTNGGAAFANSARAPLTVNAANNAPAITTNPSNVTVTTGATATFTAAASGSPTPTVQWQVSAGGWAFTNLAGGTSATLIITSTTVAMSGNK